MANWIGFEERASKSGKTKIFDVFTVEEPNHFKLGEIKWHGAWRRYAFFPSPDTLFEPTCLRDLADKCDEETMNFNASKRKK